MASTSFICRCLFERANIDGEKFAQLAATACSHFDGPDIFPTSDPAPCQETFEHCRAKTAAEMRAALGPIETLSRQMASELLDVAKIDSQGCKKSFAGGGDQEIIARRPNELPRPHRIGDRYADAAGHMVVARSRECNVPAFSIRTPVSFHRRYLGQGDDRSLDFR